MKTRTFANSPCIVAEGPRWNAADGTLYWVDVTGAGAVFVIEGGVGSEE